MVNNLITILGLIIILNVSVSTTYASNWQLSKQAGFENGDFLEFNATSIQEGLLTIVGAPPTANEGTKFAKATYNGNQLNGFSRTQWDLNWNQGTIFRTEASFYLPVGFHTNIKGAVQLMGWDTFPTLNNQMRLIIWNSDKQARLFLKTDSVDSVITNTFSIPEGQWVNLAIEQQIHDSLGWSKVYMNGQLVAQGTGDTATPYPVTRIRYGITAMDPTSQNIPFILYFDQIKLFLDCITCSPSPSPSISPIKIGDLDNNNKVDIFDYNILLTNFGIVGAAVQGDIDNNGTVNIFDYNLLLTNFGK